MVIKKTYAWNEAIECKKNGSWKTCLTIHMSKRWTCARRKIVEPVQTGLVTGFFLSKQTDKTRFANRFSDRFRTGLKTGSTFFLRMRTNKNDEKPFRFLQTDLQLRLVHLSKRQSTWDCRGKKSTNTEHRPSFVVFIRLLKFDRSNLFGLKINSSRQKPASFSGSQPPLRTGSKFWKVKNQKKMRWTIFF